MGKDLGKMETVYNFIETFSLKTFNVALKKNHFYLILNSYSHTVTLTVILTLVICNPG